MHNSNEDFEQLYFVNEYHRNSIMNKIEDANDIKVELSEDERDELNAKIVKACENNSYILIKYYDAGFNKMHAGFIKRISDYVEFFDHYNIKREDVIEALFI